MKTTLFCYTPSRNPRLIIRLGGELWILLSDGMPHGVRTQLSFISLYTCMVYVLSVIERERSVLG
jgi:hypothetical protein